jgi:hypothetical protein
MAAAGAIVTDEISFRIQDLIQKSSEIVTAQFLSDGTIFINDNNVITTPEIYLVPTVVSPSTPYPDPTQ